MSVVRASADSSWTVSDNGEGVSDRWKKQTQKGASIHRRRRRWRRKALLLSTFRLDLDEVQQATRYTAKNEVGARDPYILLLSLVDHDVARTEEPTVAVGLGTPNLKESEETDPILVPLFYSVVPPTRGSRNPVNSRIEIRSP